METIFALATAAVAIGAVCMLALYFLIPELTELRKEEQKAFRARNTARSNLTDSLPPVEPDQSQR
jgi:hypothetical protein